MARLQISQIKELIQNPKNGSNLAKSIENQEDNQLHSIPIVSKNSFTSAHRRFINWVKDGIKLNKEKLNTFQAMFNPPFQTAELLQSIYSIVALIFEAKDKHIKVTFTNTNLEEDFNFFRKERLKDFNFFKNQGIKALKDMPSSYLLVDLPPIQLRDRPEPYMFILDPVNVIDADETITTEHELITEYIIFNWSDDRIVVYDDEFYRIFNTDDEGKILTNENDFIEIPHNLGFCPARSFWNILIDNDNLQLKQNPQTASSSSLNLLLFFLIGKDISNLTDFFPITWSYPQKKDYKSRKYQGDQDFNNDDQESTFFVDNPNWANAVLNVGSIQNDKRNTDLRGSLSNIEKPWPTEDSPDIGDPIGRIPSDVQLLEYMKQDIAERKDQIHANAVGRGNVSEFLRDEQKEKTATAILQIEERRRKTLDIMKSSFEVIYKFGLETVALLRYNKDQVLNVSVNLGNDYLTFTTPELERQYKEGKSIGIPEGSLMELMEKIIISKYNNNPETQKELIIKLHVEPFPLLGIEEVNNIKDKPGRISDIDYQIKLNFVSFIQRFESENGPLIDFAVLLNFDKKIKIIKEALNDYAEEKLQEINNTEIEQIQETEEV